jgi:hypothetical protein
MGDLSGQSPITHRTTLSEQHASSKEEKSCILQPRRARGIREQNGDQGIASIEEPGKQRRRHAGRDINPPRLHAAPSI